MSIKSLISRYPIALRWPRSAYNLGIIDSISFHHSVTTNLSVNATEAQEIAILDAFHNYHKSLGFGGIGYHLCVFPSGRIYLTCKLTQWGASVGGHNNHEIGVCLVGTWTSTLPGQQQRVGGALAVDYVDKFLKRKVKLLGHKQYSGHASNACPGRIMEFLPILRSLIPAPAPVGIWGSVIPFKTSVTLYENTNLVNLETGAAIKMLPKGTKLAVAAKYKTTHYLTEYSYTRRIPNGFAISATIPPPPPPLPSPDCTKYINEIAQLKREKQALADQLVVANRQVTSLRSQVAVLQTQLASCETRRKVAEAIVQKFKDIHKAVS